jgi:hypothetical protein
MGNLLGEGFPNEIIKQIEQRQKVYGSGYAKGTSRTNEELIYLNANTSWCKLVSSVNIDDTMVIQSESLRGTPGITSSNLAKKFVLFNGVDDIDSYKLRGGINYENTLLGGTNAYGIGGNDFGIQPMMGIKSASIKSENRGSIRTATVQIKAWNKTQFDIIDLLYLRLGFNVLLEWGHSMYYDNNGDLQTKVDNSLADAFLNPKGQKIFIPDPNQTPPSLTGKTITLPLTYEVFLGMLKSRRNKSNGNYDGLFGKVKNFHWSFLKDGSYDITLDLVSVGDVIESFKVNALNMNDAPIRDVEEGVDLTKLTDLLFIDYYSNKSAIGQYFSEISVDVDQYNTKQAAVKVQQAIAQQGQWGFLNQFGSNPGLFGSGILDKIFSFFD